MYTSMTILLVVAAVFFIMSVVLLKKAFSKENSSDEIIGFIFVCIVIWIIGVFIPIGLAVYRADVIERVPFPVKEEKKR